MQSARPSVQVAVVMEREAQPNPCEIRRRCVWCSRPSISRMVRPRNGRIHLPLIREENVSGSPVWFVMWRIDEDDPSRAWPETVSLSYNEAGRWLDAQERVDNVPLPDELIAWLQAYTDAHYVPEPKKRARPQSFQRLEDRFGNPASVTTIKKFGGRGGG